MVAAQALLILSSITVSGNAQLFCFSATWCEPCRKMQPVIDRLLREGYPIHSIDIDEQKELARRYQVMAVPSLVLVNSHGKIIDRVDHATTLEHVRLMLAHYKVVPTTIRGQSPKSLNSGIQPIGEKSFLQTVDASIKPRSKAPATDLADPSGEITDLEALALAATVCLRIEDETGHSFGSGTIVDVQGQEALVLTCGHIFRESKGKGEIIIDRFDTKTALPTTGSLISFDLDLDVALVSMKLTKPITVAKLAEASCHGAARDEIFSVGCDYGQPPTVVRGRINRVNKYLGPPNITVSGTPVDGRSGGGLFNCKGLLIGVCNAADPECDEGLYGALPRIYHELDVNGLSFVYQPKQTALPNTNSGFASQWLANTAVDSAATPPLVAAQVSQVALETPVDFASAVSTQSPDELVCVLRTSGDQGKAFIIKNPSGTLLEYLQREAAKSR